MSPFDAKRKYISVRLTMKGDQQIINAIVSAASVFDAFLCRLCASKVNNLLVGVTLVRRAR